MGHIDSLEKISVVGGSDRYTFGTYKVSDGTLPGKICAISISSNAVIASLKEWRINKFAKQFEDIAYAPKFLGQTLLAGDDYYFEYPISEIVVSSGVVIFHFLPTIREAAFVDPTAATTTLAPTTGL